MLSVMKQINLKTQDYWKFEQILYTTENRTDVKI